MTTLIIEIEAGPTTGKTTIGLCVAIGAATKNVKVAYVVPSESLVRFYATEYGLAAYPGVYVLSAGRAAMNFPADATIAVLDEEDRFPILAEGTVWTHVLRRLQLHRNAQLISLRSGPVIRRPAGIES